MSTDPCKQALAPLYYDSYIWMLEILKMISEEVKTVACSCVFHSVDMFELKPTMFILENTSLCLISMTTILISWLYTKKK